MLRIPWAPNNAQSMAGVSTGSGERAAAGTGGCAARWRRSAKVTAAAGCAQHPIDTYWQARNWCSVQGAASGM